jgi:chromosomal replication initiation ATPase DnaA
MESRNHIMNQLIFKFPFKAKFYEQDFYVSENNFSAYKLIEDWPNWPGKWLNVFGVSGSGKTHLSKILEKKIEKIKIIESSSMNDNTISIINNLDCLIIDNFKDDIDQKLFYSLLNHSKQLENFILINSLSPINNNTYSLADLSSRISSFLSIGIELPTDDLLQVIISKNFSEKQINLDPKISNFIIKNVDRSYDKMFKFLKDVDELSLSSGKSININLIKKVLNK